MKKLLTLLGLSTMASATLNVTACDGKTTISEEDLTDQEIVNAINNVQYETELGFKSSCKNIKEIISPTFIKSKLDDSMQNIFQDQLFNFNQITIDDNQLSDKDLATKGIINAVINYNYGSIIDQNTNIILNVKITDRQIIDAIKENINNFREDWRTIDEIITAQEFLNDIPVLAQLAVNDILPGYLKEDYNYKLLKINNVTIDSRKLSDDDFRREGIISINFNFNYHTIKNENIIMQIIKKFKNN